MAYVIKTATYRNDSDHDGWNFAELCGDDYQSNRARRLYRALNTTSGDEEKVLAVKNDRWALFGLTISGHSYAFETDEIDENVNETDEIIFRIIEEIDFDELAKFVLLSGNDWSVYISDNGNLELVHNNIMLHSSDLANIIAVLECTDGVDEDWFTRDFAQYDSEKDAYFELETGRKIGDINDVVKECIEDGDITGYIDKWKDEIRDQIMNNNFLKSDSCQICQVDGYVLENPNVPKYLEGEKILCADTGFLVCENCDSNTREQ